MPAAVDRARTRIEGSRLQRDMVARQDACQGERAGREDAHRNDRREQHRAWEPTTRVAHLRDVDSLDLDAGEQQQDRTEERECDKPLDVREPARRCVPGETAEFVVASQPSGCPASTQ